MAVVAPALLPIPSSPLLSCHDAVVPSSALLWQRNRDWARASELKYSTIPALEKTVEASAHTADDDVLLADTVSPSHIAKVISRQVRCMHR